MKKMILAVVVLFTTVTVSAQEFYLALGGGRSYKASEKKVSNSSVFEGSYGEGYQAQLRFGYLFNEKFGVDLGVGYLQGDAQQVMETPANLKGSARAFGLALTGVYNLSKNVYVRGGLLTKLGGRTEIEGSIDTNLPNITSEGVVMVPLSIDIVRHNKGSFPLGFVGVFGVKFDLGSNFGIFAEMEYLGINVPADRSTLNSFSATLAGQAVSKDALLQKVGTLPASVQAQLGALLPLISDEVVYVDNPTNMNETKSFDAPYSSFGFNIGITYSFK